MKKTQKEALRTMLNEALYAAAEKAGMRGELCKMQAEVCVTACAVHGAPRCTES